MEKALIVSGSNQGLDVLVKMVVNATKINNVSTVASGSEARRLVSSTDYDIIVINTALTDEFGHELSTYLSEHTSSGIVLLCKSAIADELTERLMDYGVCVVAKPVNKTMFFQAIKLVTATRSRILGYQKENAKLQVKIDEIKLINRAKCVLMEYLKLTEPQAHRYIEKQAMDTRQSKKDIARDILLRYER
jgi:response regulator NasT